MKKWLEWIMIVSFILAFGSLIVGIGQGNPESFVPTYIFVISGAICILTFIAAVIYELGMKDARKEIDHDRKNRSRKT